MTINERVVGEVMAQWETDHPVVLPTDTVYGIVAPALSERAVARVFELKDRPAHRRLAVLVADIEQAGEWVILTSAIRQLALRFWPGPLTIVGTRQSGAPAWVGDETTLAVRCPDDALLRDLATRMGPLVATSANHHGERTPSDAAGVAAAFPSVELVVDGGSRDGDASTVVIARGDRFEVLRKGTIRAADIGPPANPPS